MESYEKKYKNALERARECMKDGGISQNTIDYFCNIFPELNESEDEKIRKAIICGMYALKEQDRRYFASIHIDDVIAWLENKDTKEVDPRYENLEELLAADDIYQMAMNDAMVEEAKSKAINALSELEISKLLDIEKQGEHKLSKWKEGDVVRHGGVLALVINGRRAMKSDCEQITIQYPDEWVKADSQERKYFFEELEKQSEQRPQGKSAHEAAKEEKIDNINKDEPKFKIGYWICNGGGNPCKVNYIFGNYYELCSIEDYKYNKPIRDVDANYHLWTINDARDGDVVAEDKIPSHPSPFIAIFRTKEVGTFSSHCFIGFDGDFYEGEIGHFSEKIHPATKEQRDLLFQKMKEEKYEWYADKKEIKKAIIEPKFKVGDWIVWQDKCYKVNYNGCGYELVDQNGLSTSLEYETIYEGAHLWTIKDAKDGDVLASGQVVFIFKMIHGVWLNCYCSLCSIYNDESFIAYSYDLMTGKYFSGVHPATKEQRDTLMKAMADDGYTFDFEKKELKKVEPKFHEGDFIIANDSSHIYQVMDVKRGIYIIKDLKDDVEYHIGIEEAHKSGRLWTIKDAKPGDVIYCKGECEIEYFVMNKGINKCGNIDSYFRYNSLTGFGVDIPSVLSIEYDNIIPATKEQRTLLFQKMKEAGFEWDGVNKELKKTETKGGEG